MVLYATTWNIELNHFKIRSRPVVKICCRRDKNKNYFVVVYDPIANHPITLDSKDRSIKTLSLPSITLERSWSTRSWCCVHFQTAQPCSGLSQSFQDLGFVGLLMQFGLLKFYGKTIALSLDLAVKHAKMLK